MDLEKPAGVRVAVLIRDMIFESKIRATARSLNLEVNTVRGLGELPAALQDKGLSLLIVDLNTCQNEAIEAIRTAKAAALRVVAFVSHVDVDLANQAKQAGADEVMPRSRFVANLPAILVNDEKAGE